MSPTLNCMYRRLCRADLTIVSTSANFELQNRKFLSPKQTHTFLWHSVSCSLCHCLKNSHNSPGAQVGVLWLALCCLAPLAALTVHYETVELTWGLKVRSYCSKCCERQKKQKNHLVSPVLITCSVGSINVGSLRFLKLHRHFFPPKWP